jgi:cell division protein FtsB
MVLSRATQRPALLPMLTLLIALTLGAYFAFAAVQGEFGLFRRAQLNAEMAALTAERDRLAANLAVMQNLTRRLSDGYLDLDLLDERARDVLGYLRADEVVIR